VHIDILGLGSFDAYLDWGPHFHIVGYFRIPKIIGEDGQVKRDEEGKVLKYTSDVFNKEISGWTYSNLTVKRAYRLKKPIRPETKESCRGIITYLLTHHLLERGKTGYTYFGNIAYNKVGFDEEEGYEYVKCPTCMEQMYKVYAHDIDGVLAGEIKLEPGVNAVTSKYKVKIRDYYVLQPTLSEFEDKKEEAVKPVIDLKDPAYIANIRGSANIGETSLAVIDLKDPAYIASVEKKFRALSSESRNYG
jgi:hypothetical protein